MGDFVVVMEKEGGGETGMARLLNHAFETLCCTSLVISLRRQGERVHDWHRSQRSHLRRLCCVLTDSLLLRFTRGVARRDDKYLSIIHDFEMVQSQIGASGEEKVSMVHFETLFATVYPDGWVFIRFLRWRFI